MSIKTCKTSANIKKNRLTITAAEKITKKSMDSLYTEIRFCVADLKPGFDVITDLSACTLATLSGFTTYRKITNHLIISKVGRVVRVRGGPRNWDHLCRNQEVETSSVTILVFFTLTAETLNSGILASGSKASELVRIFAGFSPK